MAKEETQNGNSVPRGESLSQFRAPQMVPEKEEWEKGRPDESLNSIKRDEKKWRLVKEWTMRRMLDDEWMRERE